ncbi:MAG: (4Fe-4S)-binding protein [Candidatus Omnitrophica bacterium]|nr:(4Fe-4S)-binding protein [Candidatus Omnitrophota bacterium]
MKQIVVISGKGGTGKTIVTSSFAALAKNKVMADCDVDAADLHLILEPDIKERHIFKSGFTARVNREKCGECGKCREICRFDAVTDDFRVDPVSCEGCFFCSRVCPEGAIEMVENTTGEWFLSGTRFGPMVHAKLGVAEENSGKLVTLVRNKAKEVAEEKGCDTVIIDGSPGTGCPVIASLSGVDLALVVVEPTMSGLHDADRVIRVAERFGIRTSMIINKYDLNMEVTSRIAVFSGEKGIELLGKIPFDSKVVSALIEKKTTPEVPGCEAGEAIREIWGKILVRV